MYGLPLVVFEDSHLAVSHSAPSLPPSFGSAQMTISSTQVFFFIPNLIGTSPCGWSRVSFDILSVHPLTPGPLPSRSRRVFADPGVRPVILLRLQRPRALHAPLLRGRRHGRQYVAHRAEWCPRVLCLFLRRVPPPASRYRPSVTPPLSPLSLRPSSPVQSTAWRRATSTSAASSGGCWTC